MRVCRHRQLVIMWAKGLTGRGPTKTGRRRQVKDNSGNRAETICLEIQ